MMATLHMAVGLRHGHRPPDEAPLPEKGRGSGGRHRTNVVTAPAGGDAMARPGNGPPG